MVSRQIITAIIISFTLGGLIAPLIQYQTTVKPLKSEYEKTQQNLIDLNNRLQKENQLFSFRYGVNYLSTNWHYEEKYLSNETMMRDFDLFRHEGISNITLAIVWSSIESQKGTYNDGYLRDIIRVCKIAETRNISVTIDFHTLMHNDSFTMPSWLTPNKFETVIKDPAARQSWLNFINHCISQLKNVPNITSWQMMNEPAIADWAAHVKVADFAQLWKEMRAVIKSSSNKPVSIRFGNNEIIADFQFDPSIDEVCDYISINYYENSTGLPALSQIVQHYSGKKIVISEFGSWSSDDAFQAYNIKEMVTAFQELKINEWSAFLWRADRSSGVPEIPGEGYNLALNENGDPRLAFYFLKPQYDIGQIKQLINSVK
jgi:Cellulase (glycosyl hydrolase family 5)